MAYFECSKCNQIIVGTSFCPDCDQSRKDRWKDDPFVIRTMEAAQFRGLLDSGNDLSDVQAGAIAFNQARDKIAHDEEKQSDIEFQFALLRPDDYKRWKEEDNFRKTQNTYKGKELEYFAPESIPEALAVLQFLENLDKNMTPVTDYKTGAEVLQQISGETEVDLSGIDVDKMVE